MFTTQVEKSFLCVAKKFRGIGLSKIIDGELMRRTINLGMKYMFYTSGFSKPATKKMCSLRYYHKTINFEKMSKLWSISNNSSITKKIIDFENGEICRQIEPKDVPICTVKLNNKLSCFSTSYIFDEEGFFHYFLPFGETVHTYVIEKDDVITDMISMYKINVEIEPKLCTEHLQYTCGYLHYYFNESKSIDELLNTLFHFCKELNIDEFCMLELTEPNDVIKKCNMIGGTGVLHYYIDGHDDVKPVDSIFVPML